MSAAAKPHSVARRMGTAAVIVSVGVLLARVLGFVRQMVFAYVLGAQATSDEYFVAFIIPDFLNYLLAGGYLAITFIPIFTRHLSRDDEEEAWRAFVAVAKPMALAIVVVVIIAVAVAHPVIRWLEPGFTALQVDRATHLTRIVLPAQVFFVLGSLLMAVQYARERFALPTLAGVIYNVGIIGGGLLLGALLHLDVEGFAWGVLAGAIVGNFLLQWVGARRVGLHWPRRVRWRHPALREYVGLALPLMLAQSVVVLDEQLGRTFGSLAGVGAISWLNYARRLMLVPVGVLGQAAGVAAYPFLARLAAEDRIDELADTLGKALRYVIFSSLGATAALLALAQPLVRVLFQRGRFDAHDTAATAVALSIYAGLVPVWGAQQIIARGFYARRQMWTPVLIGSAATAGAVPLYWWMAAHLGYAGLAAASLVALSTYCFVLATVWYHRTGWRHAVPVLHSLARALPAAACGGAAAWGVRRGLAGWLAGGHFLGSLGILVGAGLTFGVVWLGVGAAIGAPEIHELAGRLSRRLRLSKTPPAPASER